MKFFSPEVALCLYNSTIFYSMHGILLSCLGWCSYLLLELLDKLQRQIYRTVGPLLAASLEPLAYRRVVVSLSLYQRYYFGTCSSELTQPFPFPCFRRRSTRYSDILHDFSFTIPRWYKDASNSFFPRTARLWNSPPIEYFPLTYDLNGFEFRIKRHLLSVGSS